MNLNGIKKSTLKALPDREWDSVSIYDSLLIFASGHKHDSGWSGITIVGVVKDVPIEKATAYSDDVEWKLPDLQRFGVGDKYSTGQMRMDCTYPAGVLHYWTHSPMAFHVGRALSSITIELKERA